MIKIAVCDDDIRICLQIDEILKEYAENSFLEIRTQEFLSGEQILAQLNSGAKFDLIYLDIEMGKINGVEVGKHVRKVLKDYSTEIVFVSGTYGYDRQLFEVQPLHFISKPIEGPPLVNSLLIALDRAQKFAGRFKYKKGQEIFGVPIRDIMYFKSQDREVKIVLAKGEETFYGNLEDVERQVSAFRFIPVHRSYLVNFEHVVEQKYSEVKMSDGAALPISRAKRKGLRNFLLCENGD